MPQLSPRTAPDADDPASGHDIVSSADTALGHLALADLADRLTGRKRPAYTAPDGTAD
ncbi:MAG: hypothetical protein ACJ762_07285 [Solirubrobacteraceae bacterium]